MIKSFAIATTCVVGLLATPAFAQDAGSSGSPPQFVNKEPSGQWRATKLSGVAVYGADNQKIGAIDDILIDSQGQAKVAVIGIGGFLGVGQKNVGVPFDSLKFNNQAEGRTAASGSNNTAANSSGSAEYPASATLSATKDQLQNAPNFQYASNQNNNSGGNGASNSQSGQ